MKVLVAGASGVIGKQLVPVLEAAGHEVVGLARSVRGQMGTTALAVDALDRDAVVDVVMENQPDAIVNLLTALPDRISHKRIDHDFVMTNRLRKVGKICDSQVKKPESDTLSAKALRLDTSQEAPH